MSYTYNNISLASTKFKLQSNNFPQLVRNKKEVSVIGRNGSIFIDQGTYANRVIECTHISTEYKNDSYTTLFNFFGASVGELVFDDNKKLKWIVDDVQLDDIEEQGNGIVHSFKASFVCQPFRKLVNEKEYQITTSTLNVKNEGVIKCCPNFTIQPLGYKTNIVITVNGKNFTILNVQGSLGTVKVLGDSKTVIQGKKVLETSGEFPVLNQGNNTITGTESFKSATIMMNENYA